MANAKVRTSGTGGRNRFCRRADAKVGARKARRREDAALEAQGTEEGHDACPVANCFCKEWT